MKAADCVDKLKRRATALGFQSCRITEASVSATTAQNLRQYVELGRHGDMHWMAETLDRRVSPDAMWPLARSAIVLAMNYAPEADPLARLADRQLGNISVYALGRDYHEIIKGKLKTLAQWLVSATRAEAKVFVDTAPLMEKPLAAAAGIGWQGKHTNLVSREFGSWLFLGVILSAANLKVDDGEIDHCGTCHACLDICPTRAFPAPYQLDARRCISYLTIEHEGHIDRSYRQAMGNRIYGCDDCLAACPWNKFAVAARETKLTARADLAEVKLDQLLKLDDAQFRKLFASSPVRRSGRNRFIRNVLIAAGNSSNVTLVPQIKVLLDDTSPLVRAMAIWALAQLDRASFQQEKRARAAQEEDEAVQLEWQEALS